MGDRTIGRLAREAGVSIETIRFYERNGLIERPPRPIGSGFRHYPQEMIARLRFIREAQALGFSLSEISDLLSLRADKGAACTDVRARAEAKLGEVRKRLHGLRRMELALETLIAACPGEGPAQDCTILDAIARPPATKSGKGSTQWA